MDTHLFQLEDMEMELFSEVYRTLLRILISKYPVCNSETVAAA